MYDSEDRMAGFDVAEGRISADALFRGALKLHTQVIETLITQNETLYGVNLRLAQLLEEANKPHTISIPLHDDSDLSSSPGLPDVLDEDEGAAEQAGRLQEALRTMLPTVPMLGSPPGLAPRPTHEDDN
jgi:hypothetical protein